MKALLLAMIVGICPIVHAQYVSSQDVQNAVVLQHILQQQQEQRRQPQSLFDVINAPNVASASQNRQAEETRQIELKNQILRECLQLLQAGAKDLPEICNNLAN